MDQAALLGGDCDASQQPASIPSGKIEQLEYVSGVLGDPGRAAAPTLANHPVAELVLHNPMLAFRGHEHLGVLYSLRLPGDVSRALCPARLNPARIWIRANHSAGFLRQQVAGKHPATDTGDQHQKSPHSHLPSPFLSILAPLVFQLFDLGAGWCFSEFAPKEFDYNISDESGRNCNGKIGRRKNVGDGPGQSHPSAPAGTGELAHQKIGVEKKNDEANFDHCSPNGLLHYREFNKTKNVEAFFPR
jgi:hypothetical protein